MESRLYYTINLSEAPAFILSGLPKDTELSVVPDFTMQPKGILRKILKFLFVGRFPLPGYIVEWITGYKGYTWLSTLRPCDRLLLPGIINIQTLRALAYLTCKSVRRYQYFNNSLRFIYAEDKISSKVLKMQKLGYHLVTFDTPDFGDASPCSCVSLLVNS